MQNFAQIANAFSNRKAQEKKILKGAKTMKVYEVATSVFNTDGEKIHIDIIKTQSPKQALALQRDKLSLEGVKVYTIKTVVSPTPKNGYIAYEVVKNAHIIR